jgi:CxxC-x17-CxxC domain-containing protein
MLQESAMSFADRTLTCRDCGQAFTFTSGEQEFFAQKGFTSDPSRCPTCRASRRSERGGSSGSYGGSYSGGGYNADPYRSAGSGSGSGYGRQERPLYSAICSTCGQEARVPFQPRDDRPVYCADCFTPTRGAGGSGSGGRRDYR